MRVSRAVAVLYTSRIDNKACRWQGAPIEANKPFVRNGPAAPAGVARLVAPDGEPRVLCVPPYPHVVPVAGVERQVAVPLALRFAHVVGVDALRQLQPRAGVAAERFAGREWGLREEG